MPLTQDLSSGSRLFLCSRSSFVNSTPITRIKPVAENPRFRNSRPMFADQLFTAAQPYCISSLRNGDGFLRTAYEYSTRLDTRLACEFLRHINQGTRQIRIIL